jgi:2-keto-4-pentenoate hydratase
MTMLDYDIKAASGTLWDCWQAGGVVDGLAAPMCPASRAEGYAIQALLMAHTSKPLFGWKIAATSTAGQKHINVDGPLAGRILAERVVPKGSDVHLGTNRMRVAEAEFAFRMARDLPPRALDYGQDEVVAAIDTMHPAIEVPDSRYADFTTVGAAQLIADNACAHQFALGAATTMDWRGIDLATHKVVGTISGRRGRSVKHEGTGANVLGGPLIAMTWIANELSRIGVGLKAGEVVTTGTCVIPLPLQEGDVVIADFGVFGRMSLSFS